MNAYGIVRHPRTGEQYVVEYEDGEMIRAAGPVYQTPPYIANIPSRTELGETELHVVHIGPEWTEELLANYIANQPDGEARDDAVWLRRELEHGR